MPNLVRCNNCMLEVTEFEDNPIFECPKCDTADYLMDLGYVNE